MKLVGWFALAALPGCAILALSFVGVPLAPGWYHLIGLVAVFSTIVTVGAGVLVSIADRVKGSRQTARLRAGMAVACVLSAMLLWMAAALAFSDGVGDAATVFLALLPFPLIAAAALDRRGLAGAGSNSTRP